VSATPSERSGGPGGPARPGGEARASRGGRYHHGDLKAALVDGAIELIAERGVRGFSLAELSRRLGVTVAAPYRHFTDRDELLAAVAVRALHAFADALAAGSGDGDPPEQRLAAMARGYVRFAAEQRPLFDVVYATDLDKSRHPELVPAYEGVEEPFSACVARLCPDDPEAAAALEDALEASARGHAALLLEGSYGEGPDAVDRAAAQAARTTVALIEGFGVHRPAGPAPL
jgi:AcrR family transcriptional regulator